jgi:polyphosphate kinase
VETVGGKPEQVEPSGPLVEERGHYINRELSWPAFNQHVLDEALNTRLPLLERVKFLAIFANNLDEFFMIRVAGLRSQVAAGIVDTPPDGMSAAHQLAAIRQALITQLASAVTCWQKDLFPALRKTGVTIDPYSALSVEQKATMRRYFTEEVFPVLTPLAFDPAHPFPHISNLSLNLAVILKDGERSGFARVKIGDVAPRLVSVPASTDGDTAGDLGLPDVPPTHFVWLEEVVRANLDMLFPGVEVVAAYPFRITRDADFEINDDEASDLLENVEAHVELRHWGDVVRLEVDASTPNDLREVLVSKLEIAPYQVYLDPGPLGMASLMELTAIDRPDLKLPPHAPVVPSVLTKKESIFSVIRREDLILYHPYDSFMPVVDFVREAASDPNVVAIKQTLYRVGVNSPIVKALMDARGNEKQVAVLLELKARFDEENNIAWARALEDEGVHVVYGVLGLKTHAKICMVVRRDPDGMRRYVHMSTGNYNAQSGRIYTDISFFTCDPVIGEDSTNLFNALTGYARKDIYQKLLVAPGSMRRQIVAWIEREAARHRDHGDGYIAFKMNSLVDKTCIDALYRASQAGVRIDLQVRGICCLRPGIPGVSETINVTSIVGRFLEHARIYYFHNGGDEEVFLGSADLMPRNLDRRVEILFPIEAPSLRRTIVEDILRVHLRDNVQARQLQPDGTYERLHSGDGPPFNSQEWFMTHWREGDSRTEDAAQPTRFWATDD